MYTYIMFNWLDLIVTGLKHRTSRLSPLLCHVLCSHWTMICYTRAVGVEHSIYQFKTTSCAFYTYAERSEGEGDNEATFYVEAAQCSDEACQLAKSRALHSQSNLLHQILDNRGNGCAYDLQGLDPITNLRTNHKPRKAMISPPA